MEWPVWIDEYPPGFRSELERISKDLQKYKAGQETNYNNSEIVEEAKKISKKAKELSRLVQKFHNKAGIHSYIENHRSAALEHIISLTGPTEEELRFIQVGFSKYSLPWTLSGLDTHMQVIYEDCSGKDGRKKKHLERWAIRQLLEISTKVGISLGRGGYKRTHDIFDYLFANAEIEPPGESVFKHERRKYKDEVENLREISKDKTHIEK
ncbi:MAG: hypothetical protein ABW082_04655 [Sedimenticola sp.]